MNKNINTRKEHIENGLIYDRDNPVGWRFTSENGKELLKNLISPLYNRYDLYKITTPGAYGSLYNIESSKCSLKVINRSTTPDSEYIFDNEVKIGSIPGIEAVGPRIYAYKKTHNQLIYIMDRLVTLENSRIKQISLLTLNEYYNKVLKKTCPAPNHPIYKELSKTLVRFYTLTKGYHGNLNVYNIMVLLDKTLKNPKVRIIDYGAHRLFEGKVPSCLGDIFKLINKEFNNSNNKKSVSQNLNIKTPQTGQIYRSNASLLTKSFGKNFINKLTAVNHNAARKIQTAFRKSRLSNEEYIKLSNKRNRTGLTNTQLKKMQSFVNRTGKNYNSLISDRSKNAKAVPAVTKIQSVFRGYTARVIEPRKQFLISLEKDGRFEYYVKVLYKLEHRVDTVLKEVRQGMDPRSVITDIIGVCHYTPEPHVIVENVDNVRKNLPLLKKKTPREYLQTFRKQFSYVAKEYAKMDAKNKKEYRDRLSSELSGRPCLENLLDSLTKALLKQEFVWLGKSQNYQNNPLLRNNARYLGYGPNLMINGVMKKGLVNTAIKTWRNSGNRPINWNNKNVNSRKQMFWDMIKNLPLSMVFSGNVVDGTLSVYNTNGKKFKSSNLANTLEYI